MERPLPHGGWGVTVAWAQVHPGVLLLGPQRINLVSLEDDSHMPPPSHKSSSSLLSSCLNSLAPFLPLNSCLAAAGVMACGTEMKPSES